MAYTPPEFAFSMTAPGQLLFPRLLKPEAFKDPKTGKDKGDPVYSVDVLIDETHNDVKELKARAVGAAKKLWPELQSGAAKLAYKEGTLFFLVTKDDETIRVQLPFKKGDALADARKVKQEAADKEADGEYQRGKIVLKTKSKFQPALVAPGNGTLIDLTTEELKQKNAGAFYSGVDAFVEVSLMATEVSGNKYVTAYCQSVTSLNRGKKIGGERPSTADRFKGYVGSVSNVDPTMELDDEVSF